MTVAGGDMECVALMSITSAEVVVPEDPLPPPLLPPRGMKTWLPRALLGAAAVAAVTAAVLVGVLVSHHHRGRAPNFVLFSLDDSLTESTWKYVYNYTLVPSGARNPNGCRPPVTWFTNCCQHNKTTSTCTALQHAHAIGHEIATHTMTHPMDTKDYDYEDWAAEVEGQRSWVVDTCGIPAEDVNGFRAPYFHSTDLLGEVIGDLGFLYDSTLKGEDLSGRVLHAGALNSSFVPDCSQSHSTCNGWKGQPFWEVPVYMPPGHGATRSDPVPADGMSILQRFQADFKRKSGSGIPVSIVVHSPYLKYEIEHRQAVTDFLLWATQQPNTWAVTYRQYVAWMQAPRGTPMESILAPYICDSS